MSPSGGIGRRVRFRCVCPRGRGGSSPLSGTQHNEGFCITINTEAFFVFEIYDINRIEALTLRSSASRFILYNIVVVGFVRIAFLSSAADLSSLKALSAFSRDCFFKLVIWLGCSSYFEAICWIVSRSLSAFRTTFVLNLDPKCLLFLFMTAN